ncbi:beta-ketoacyl synthase N-terminal-like domain-containing protein [Gordonia westfalica]|uniref:Beta-ketoacyl synthase N-terminal-like domain-containing protein n=1 Tax=Gordonia westfalica TaxID=158898 RepID=A0ABU2GYA2_9ACTN|nr:beta-ketoacyl synthase N-terminal-like domain-containing protein [Gordonia westfalica]MDS1115739.1 beta-ketoacyl synthase N-terminal-like domain-containing protein [Gordonia westfalica]
MTNNRSTISGVGAVTGYGWGREALWNGLASGKSAAALHEGFGFGSDDHGGPGWIVRVPEGGDQADGRTRFARAMRSAAREAIEDASERGWRPGSRVGLVHACVLGDLDMYPMVTSGVGQYTGRQYLSVTPSTPVSLLMQEYGFHGPALNVSAMCTSGSAAIVTAKSWLDSDLVDDVLVVATDLSAKPEVVGMFVQLGVAITDTDALDACRPFQEGSRGFTFGEAAIAFTMTNRTTDGYADVLGGAMSHDAFHVTSIDPELTNVVGCVEQALATSGVAGEDIRYVNAHGPGTSQCDRAEATIVETLLPNSEVFSVKPLAGHCQGAAGAVELAASLLGYERGEIPATPRVSDGIPQLLDGLSPLETGPTLKTSLGMGGHNAALVIAPQG